MAAGNGIKELKAEEEYSPEASGSAVVVTTDKENVTPDFTLIGPTEVCPGKPIKVAISNLKGFGRGERKITWTVKTGDSSKEYKNKNKLVLPPSKV